MREQRRSPVSAPLGIIDPPIRLLMLSLAVMVSPSAFGQAESPKITGLYSNMRAGTEDLSGVEVFPVRGEGGYFATV